MWSLLLVVIGILGFVLLLSGCENTDWRVPVGFCISCICFFITGIIEGYEIYNKEHSTKEYKTEQVRTEIIGGDTTVYFKIVKIE